MPTISLVDPCDSAAPAQPRSCAAGSRIADVAAAVQADTGGKCQPIAALLAGRLVGLDSLLPEEGEPRVELLEQGDPRALPVMRHSAAHVMARAVLRLFKDVELAFGPTVGDGFY
jgi:hypothetical protein